MQETLKQRMLEVCDKKIARKGIHVGISFYAFFTQKNDNPELLMEAAEWWIQIQRLDHFEKAVKIRKLLENTN